MARTNSIGFFPAAGTDYTQGQEPLIASRLNRLAHALKIRLTGISGFRTPAHSVAVGGSANDPHTTGSASDTGGAERIPESVLERFGLTRPFPGAREANHIQLFGSSTKGRRTPGTYSLGELWISAGGDKRLAPIMAAIALAESGGNKGAVGGPNSDGTYDYGLWQINSSHSQYSKSRLLSDPLYNARAAVAIYRSQGLRAWSTYNNGAYKSHMGQSSGSLPTFGRPRPGGQDQGSDSGAGVDTVFDAYTQDASWHWSPFSPLPLPFKPPGPSLNLGNDPITNTFKDAAKAVNGTADFLKWIAWIFHPRNVLRIVEFLSGMTLIILGIHTMIQVSRDAESLPQRGARRTRRAAGIAFGATPAGRAVRVRRAARFGRLDAKNAARGKEAAQARKSARMKESKRLGDKQRTESKSRGRIARGYARRREEKPPF